MRPTASLLATSLALAACGGVMLPPARGAVSVPALFSDHAVLQRVRPVPVWGTADRGEEVRVSFAGQTKAAPADGRGGWRVRLDPPHAGAALTLTVQSRANTVTARGVLVGEVWLGSGQSNM